MRATAAHEPSQEIGIAKRIVRYRLNGWFPTLQLGTGEHTVRDRSQENRAVNQENTDIWAEDTGMAASPSKMT
jgi:hypothetical protein